MPEMIRDPPLYKQVLAQPPPKYQPPTKAPPIVVQRACEARAEEQVAEEAGQAVPAPKPAGPNDILMMLSMDRIQEEAEQDAASVLDHLD